MCDDGSRSKYVDEREAGKAMQTTYLSGAGYDSDLIDPGNWILRRVSHECLRCPTECWTTESKNACLDCATCQDEPSG